MQEALREIIRHRAALYEPAAVDACLELFQKENFSFAATVGET